MIFSQIVFVYVMRALLLRVQMTSATKKSFTSNYRRTKRNLYSNCNAFHSDTTISLSDKTVRFTPPNRAVLYDKEQSNIVCITISEQLQLNVYFLLEFMLPVTRSVRRHLMVVDQLDFPLAQSDLLLPVEFLSDSILLVSDGEKEKVKNQ